MNPTVTIFADKFGTRIMTAKGMTMPEVEEMIRIKPRRLKDELPLLKFAEFGDQRTPEAQSLRHDANVVRVTGIEGDCDDDITPMQDAVDRLKAAGIAALFYTSASHMAQGKGRWRVLCFLKTPIEGPEDELRAKRKHWVGVLNAYLGGVLKGESFSLSQSYYFGPLAGKLPPVIKRIDGKCIDELSDNPEPLFSKSNGAAGHAVASEPKSKDASHSADLLHKVRADMLAGMDDEDIIEKYVTSHPHCTKFKKADKAVRAVARCIERTRNSDGWQGPKAMQGEEFGGERVPATPKKKASLIVENAGDLEEMAIEWIVPNYFPRGMLSAIAGYGGEGKSIILTTIMAALSQGKNFINGQPLPKPISMLIITEEAFQQLTLPRLNFNGADTNRIGRIRGVTKPKGDDESWNLVDHIREVREYLVAHPEKEVLLIDPVGNYMSGKSRSIDSTQDSEVRSVLRLWQELAEELNVSIMYLAHFNKSKTTHIHEKVMGSAAFVTSTRITFGVGKMAPERVEELGFPPIDPSQGSYRVMFPIKGNIGILPPPVLFKFELVEGTIVPRVTVEAVLPHGFEVMLAEDVLVRPSQRGKSDGSKGPTLEDRIVEAAQQSPGISREALAMKLGVQSPNLGHPLNRLEQDGKIVRLKAGKEMQVFVPEDAALFG